MDCRREGKDWRGVYAECQRSGSMDRWMMGTEDFEEALRIIMDEENSRSEQNQQITVSTDIVQHTYAFFFFSLPSSSSFFFFGIVISQSSPLHPTHTCYHTLSQNYRPCWTFSPRSCGEGGQSGIYVLQFIFVLEAPRGLSSMLAWGNYTYTPPISPPITAP